MFSRRGAIQDRNQKQDALMTTAPGTQRTGAVVVGGCFQGLGIVRSLGRRGIPVCVIDDEPSISHFSRYTTHYERVATLRDEQKVVETVLDVGKRHGLKDWVLYPTLDETVAAFSRYRSELTGFFRVPTPDWESVQWAWDKRNTYRLAEELGIPAPRTWYPKSLEELEPLEKELPLAIKPAIKEHFIYATKAKAWRADTPAELRERFLQATTLVGTDEAMVQELIPGDGQQQYAYGAFYKDGRVIASMVARRLRQHPPEFGRASTYVETVEQPLLEEYSERFLQAMNYYGLVEVEYKLDPRDGRYKILDVNARTWGYHTLGQRAGVDFPYLLFADQMGEHVDSYRAKVGVKWVRLVTDLATSMVEIRRGHLNWKTYVRSLKEVNIESVFSRDDLLPGLVELSLIPYLIVKRGF